MGKHHRVSGPVTSVARVEDVQIFLKDPVYSFYYLYKKMNYVSQYGKTEARIEPKKRVTNLNR